MSYDGGNKNWRGGKRQGNRNFRDKDKNTVVPESDSPVIKEFINYRNELDAKHDKTERLIKISRDITIESKRIIFSLHSNGDIPKTVAEAKSRLRKLATAIYPNIAKELDKEDQYQFMRAFSPGIQEFVEAYTFCQYLDTGELLPSNDIQSQLIYNRDEQSCDMSTGEAGKEMEINDDCIEDEVKPATVVESTELVDTKNENPLKIILTPAEYMLGVEDLTGELMRHCINSLSNGNIDAVFGACDFVKRLHSRLSSFSRVPIKEFYRKLNVTRQSLMKMENTCYFLRLRSNEVPKHMLGSIMIPQDHQHMDEDEGFY